jgi:WD40 repeat protein
LNGIRFLKYLSTNGSVASCSFDNTINIWNPNTGESIRIYAKHTNTVNDFDQIDVDTVVSGSDDKAIHIWEISTGETLLKIDAGDLVYSVKSLSNSLIACGLKGGNISIYEYSTGNLAKTLIGHSNIVYSLELLNEQFMASGSWDKNIIIWDLYSYSIKYNLSQHESSVWCIKRLSSNLMASGDSSGLMIIWNWLNGTLVYKLNAHDDYVSSLDLYDDQTLISGSEDTKIKLWNISNGQLIKTINTDIQISSLVMLNRGKKKYFKHLPFLYFLTLKKYLNYREKFSFEIKVKVTSFVTIL